MPRQTNKTLTDKDTKLAAEILWRKAQENRQAGWVPQQGREPRMETDEEARARIIAMRTSAGMNPISPGQRPVGYNLNVHLTPEQISTQRANEIRQWFVPPGLRQLLYWMGGTQQINQPERGY